MRSAGDEPLPRETTKGPEPFARVPSVIRLPADAQQLQVGSVAGQLQPASGAGQSVGQTEPAAAHVPLQQSVSPLGQPPPVPPVDEPVLPPVLPLPASAQVQVVLLEPAGHEQTGGGVVPASPHAQAQFGSLAGQAQPQGVGEPASCAGRHTVLAERQPQAVATWSTGQTVPASLQLQSQGPVAGQEHTQLGGGASQVHWPLGWQTGCWPDAQGGSGPVQPVPASATQMSGQAVPSGMQLPEPLQPQK